MKPVLLATATVVGLLAPLPVLASPASASVSAQASASAPASSVECARRAWERIGGLSVAGRRAGLFKCKGQPFYHAGLVGGVARDLVRVYEENPSTGRRGYYGKYAGSSGEAATRARVLADGDRAWVCLRLSGATGFSCSKAYPYLEACEGVDPRSTSSTIPRGCRL